MNEQRIREIVREEIAKDKEAAETTSNLIANNTLEIYKKMVSGIPERFLSETRDTP